VTDAAPVIGSPTGREHRQRELLVRCLDAVRRARAAPFATELLVLDNASHDGSPARRGATRRSTR